MIDAGSSSKSLAKILVPLLSPFCGFLCDSDYLLWLPCHISFNECIGKCVLLLILVRQSRRIYFLICHLVLMLDIAMRVSLLAQPSRYDAIWLFFPVVNYNDRAVFVHLHGSRRLR